MPVQQFVTEPHLHERGLRQLLGLQHAGLLRAARGYALADPVREFREMVRALHGAGLEVILDVVFNHTAEGGDGGPTLSMRGIDNLSYYRLEPHDLRHNINWTGCGNTLNLDHPRGAAPGARLPALLGGRHARRRLPLRPRHDAGPRGRALRARGPVLHALQQDPVLAGVKLIAEPWDLGPDGYQLGGFPRQWAEWNDRFRDTVRGFWRGDPAVVPRLAERLAGSSDLFQSRGPGPPESVNYVACHDGFTLRDVVSYARKHNEANGEDNRDGDNHAVSWNTASRARPTTRRSSACATASSATCWRRCCCRRACRCCRRATSSAARSAATTTPTARTTRFPGWTGGWRAATRRCSSSCASC
jgi:isoamylase